MTYETVLKAAGDGCEAVVTLSGSATPLTTDEIEAARGDITRAFETWFGVAPETVAVVANCPVQESDDPGTLPD